MNTLHVVEYFLTGTMTFVYDIVLYGDGRKKVFTQYSDDSKFDFSNIDVYIAHNRFKRIFFHLESSWRFFNRMLPFTIKKIEAIVKRENITTIFSHFGPQGLYALDVKIRNPWITYVVMFHGFDVYQLKGYWPYTHRLKKLFKHADSILAISEDIRSELIKLGCPEEKVKTIYLGVDVQDINPKKRNAGACTFLHISGYTEKKGISLIAKSILKLDIEENFGKFRFVFAGYGPDKHIVVKLAEKVKFVEVIILGYVFKSDKESLYKTSDYFLHPSVTAKNGDKEGIPISIKEAMANGLPCISTLHSGIPEVVKYNNGFLVDEASSDGLTNAIITAADQLHTDEYLFKSDSAHGIIKSHHNKIVNLNAIFNTIKENE